MFLPGCHAKSTILPFVAVVIVRISRADDASITNTLCELSSGTNAGARESLLHAKVLTLAWYWIGVCAPLASITITFFSSRNVSSLNASAEPSGDHITWGSLYVVGTSIS